MIAGIQGADRFIDGAVDAARANTGSPLQVQLAETAARLPKEYGTSTADRFMRLPLDARMVPFVRSQLFVSLMAEVEDMFAELVRAVLLSFPKKISRKDVAVAEMIDAQGRGEVLRRLIEAELSGVFYGGPAKLRTFVEKVISGPELLAENWPQYVEMRARRDNGMHAGWKWSRVYAEKAGTLAEPETAEWLHPSREYFEGACERALSVCHVLGDHCASKFSHCTPARLLKEMWEGCPLSRVMSYDEAWEFDDPPRPTDKALEWGWSSGESLLYGFFQHIYGRHDVNVVGIFERFPGEPSRMLREWLSRPFYF